MPSRKRSLEKTGLGTIQFRRDRLSNTGAIMARPKRSPAQKVPGTRGPGPHDGLLVAQKATFRFLIARHNNPFRYVAPSAVLWQMGRKQSRCAYYQSGVEWVRPH